MLFVIARGKRTEAQVVVVDIEQNRLHGVGECTPSPRYSEIEASVIWKINSVLQGIAQGITRDVLLQLLSAAAVPKVIDSVLYDLGRAAAGQMFAEYAGGGLPIKIATVQILSIDAPQNMVEAALRC